MTARPRDSPSGTMPGLRSTRLTVRILAAWPTGMAKGYGISEETIGRWLRRSGHRDDIVLATKGVPADGARPQRPPAVRVPHPSRLRRVAPRDAAAPTPVAGPSRPSRHAGAVLPLGANSVGELVDELGVPGLADVHVHFMPERMLQKVWAVFDRAGEVYGRPWPIRYRLPEDERLAVLRSFGVRRFAPLVYAHKPGMAEWLNGWMRSWTAGVPDAVPTATFFPEPSASRYLAEALDDGARVVKLHLEVGGFDPRDPLLDDAWGLCAAAGVPLVVHCGSGPVPGPFTGPGPIGEVLARHPALRLVVAHFGVPEYEDFVELAERHSGVALDTTMAGTDFTERVTPFPPSLRPRARALALAGKVVLGSDFPNIPYAYEHQLAALPRLGVDTPETLAATLWHAPAALLS
jgi:hypothetical protein